MVGVRRHRGGHAVGGLVGRVLDDPRGFYDFIVGLEGTAPPPSTLQEAVQQVNAPARLQGKATQAALITEGLDHATQVFGRRRTRRATRTFKAIKTDYARIVRQLQRRSSRHRQQTGAPAAWPQVLHVDMFELLDQAGRALATHGSSEHTRALNDLRAGVAAAALGEGARAGVPFEAARALFEVCDLDVTARMLKGWVSTPTYRQMCGPLAALRSGPRR